MQKEIAGQGRGDVNYNESDLLVRLFETKWERFFLFNLCLSLPQTPQTSRENLGFPGGAGGKEPACHCRRHKRRRFDPWAGNIPRRRAWQPTPVFLPGESYRQRSLAGYSPQGHTESDTTEVTWHANTRGEIYAPDFSIQ